MLFGIVERPDNAKSLKRRATVGNRLFAGSHALCKVSDLKLGVLSLPLDQLDIQPGGNMRKSDTDETGYLCYKDIWYRYSKGKLASVTWYNNNLRFQLTAVSDTFANHPEAATETFVGKLLSAETAQATVASLPIFEAAE